MSNSTAFIGTIPATYHRYLGPLIFEDFAADLVRRLAIGPGERVLELACGTGIVTRRLATALPDDASLISTDLNEAMLAVAREVVGPNPRVTFQQANACAIPFPDASFDALACQFSFMFFPDKVHAMREARRVLRPGGRYVLNIWDAIEHSPIARVVHEAAVARFPDNPPDFLKAAPYGYFDRAEIERVCRAGGFTSVKLETIEFPSVAPTAEDAARAFIDGTPLLVALQDRGMTDTTLLRAAATKTLAAEFGAAPCRSTVRGIVIELA